jgi:hypothetical protein
VTVIAAVSLFDGVMLIADSQVTFTPKGRRAYHCDIAQKIFPLTANMALAFSGDVQVAAMLAPRLIRHMKRRPNADAPQDAIDDLPIVERGPALASSLRRQKGFEQTPLRFAQVAATQSCLPPRGILESKPESRVNRFVNSA